MSKRKRVHKVRALVTDRKGRAYAITGDAKHVLQLPGGTRKASESPRKAIRREVREETGYRCRIVRQLPPVTVRRNGVKEVTICFLVVVTEKAGKPRMTGREAARGLRVKKFTDREALTAALRARVAKYGRSAARRDLKLTNRL